MGDSERRSRSTPLRWATGCAPGLAKVPVDVVVEGPQRRGCSMVTGESMPVTKSLENRVIGGRMIGPGGLVNEAAGVGRDTVLSSVVQLVRRKRSRAPIRLADQVSSYFVRW